MLSRPYMGVRPTLLRFTRGNQPPLDRSSTAPSHAADVLSSRLTKERTMPARSPRRCRRLVRTVTGVLLVSALAAPAADARPDAFRPHTVESVPAVTNPTQAPTVTRTIDDGFDVGSAAIGAGGAAAALLLTGAGTAAISRHRRIGALR
jgi:hypothetical protein